MPLSRRVAAELVATMLLVAAVVGSGIMADRLAGPGAPAVALLANTIATAATLVALILAFGAVSGAQMNPVVSVVMAARGKLAWRDVTPYAIAQTIGGCLGAWLAHAMFALPVLQVATHERAGGGLWLGEVVATFALLTTIFGCERSDARRVPFAVAAVIAGAYWFTSSTSFANPAVTIARACSDTFAGIAPSSVPAFVIAQCLGAALAHAFDRWLHGKESPACKP